MAIKLTNKPDTITQNIDYPYGDIRDRNGVTPGTPVSREVYADFHQFFERMMDLSGFTHNNLPDNQTNGFQLFESFMRLANSNCIDLTYSISQTGTSDPVITMLSATNPLPNTANLVATRLSLGVYEIKAPYSGGAPGSWFDMYATAPNAIQLIPSAGSVGTSAEQAEISFQIGYNFSTDTVIRITTKQGGIDSDDLLKDHVFTLRVYIR